MILLGEDYKMLRILTLAFAFVIPFSQFFSVRILFGALILSVFVRRDWNAILLRSWDIGIYLLVLVLGMIYSIDFATGMKYLETNFSLLAVPLVFSTDKELDEERLNTVIYSFIAGLTLACIICLTNSFIDYYQSGDNSVFLFYRLTKVINSHPTYLSYYLIFAITFGLYLLFYQKSKYSNKLIFAAVTFFFVMLLLTGGRTAFTSMIFVFSFFILKFLVESNDFLRWSIFVMILLMIICMFLVVAIEQVSRDSILNDSWERFSLWSAALNAIPNFVFGVGTGDYRIVLNEYYQTHNLVEYAAESYNAHNQFIQTLFANGILGFASLIILIFRPLYLAAKYQHPLWVLVFFPFLIYGMTEVFLGRYQGVVFFALLHQLFISYFNSRKPHLSLLKKDQSQQAF